MVSLTNSMLDPKVQGHLTKIVYIIVSTLAKTNIAHESLPSQKGKARLQTIHFSGPMLNFGGVRDGRYHHPNSSLHARVLGMVMPVLTFPSFLGLLACHDPPSDPPSKIRLIKP